MEACLDARWRHRPSAGKRIPYFVLGMIAMTLATGTALFLLGVPFPQVVGRARADVYVDPQSVRRIPEQTGYPQMQLRA
jgi:hypothetical protein